MVTLNEIETAVSRLSADQLAQFRQWFAEFDAERWDQQLERDTRSGKLDAFAEQALDHHRSGRCTPL